MIDINLLSKTYGEQTVLDIDQLHIPTGQTFGLVGNNGAGKTTLFSLMLDLIAPTTGTVTNNDIVVLHKGKVVRDEKTSTGTLQELEAFFREQL